MYFKELMQCHEIPNIFIPRVVFLNRGFELMTTGNLLQKTFLNEIPSLLQNLLTIFIDFHELVFC